MEIRYKRYPRSGSPRFSILIPTWNNLPYLQRCVESLRQHSTFEHQLILHVNEGADGTLKWARAQELDHSFSVENVGVCAALNAAASLADTDYIAFFNDDMVALPGWDAALWAVIERLEHDRWFLSATMIEPRDTGNPCVIAPQDFGQTAEDFQEAELLKALPGLQKADWCGATWPPNVLPKKLWDEVGGYSLEFSPGMSSDPDFSMKLWQAGVRHFQGVGASRAYHFQAKSTGKITKNPGPQQFLAKWGISQGTFGKYYLRRGQPWQGPLPEAGPGLSLALARLLGRLKHQLGRLKGIRLRKKKKRKGRR
jgi:glycosyltransferase involved in cell wall biosynthesis